MSLLFSLLSFPSFHIWFSIDFLLYYALPMTMIHLMIKCACFLMIIISYYYYLWQHLHSCVIKNNVLAKNAALLLAKINRLNNPYFSAFIVTRNSAPHEHTLTCSFITYGFFTVWCNALVIWTTNVLDMLTKNSY